MSLLNELLNSAQEFLSNSNDIYGLFETLRKHLPEYEQKDVDNAIYTLIGDLKDSDVEKRSDYLVLTSSMYYIHVMNFLCTLEEEYQPSDEALGALFKAILSENKALLWRQFISPFVFKFYSPNYVKFVLEHFAHAFPLQCFMSFCQKAAIFNHIEIVEQFCSFNNEQFVKDYKKGILCNVPVSADMFKMLMNPNATHVLSSVDIDEVFENIITTDPLPSFLLETINFLCGLEGKNKPLHNTLLRIMNWALPFTLSLGEDDNAPFKKLVFTIKEKVDSGDAFSKAEVVVKDAKKVKFKQGSEGIFESGTLVKKICFQSDNDLDLYGNIIQRLETYQTTEKQYPKRAEWRLFKWYYDDKIQHRKANEQIAAELLRNLSKTDVSKKDLSKKEIIKSIEIIEKGHTIRSDRLNSIFKDAKKVYRREHNEETFLERLFPCIK